MTARSQHALAARQFDAFDTEGLSQCPADALETRLDHVVRVVAAHRHVDRSTEAFGERAEYVGHELRGQPTDRFATEPALEYRVRSTREVDGHLRLGFVHRQQEAVACDADLIAERIAQ